MDFLTVIPAKAGIQDKKPGIRNKNLDSGSSPE